MKERLELISFKLCPFVQRSIILLKEKQVDFTLTHIDLQNKPEWFLRLSPTGKVPVLKVNDEVLFESSVINEFLDERYTPSLHPTDLILKAKHRAWIEFSSTLFFDMMNFLSATEKQSLIEKRVILWKKFRQLEKEITDQFFAEKFSLVDVAFAPILLRLSFVAKKVPDLLADFPKLQHWQEVVIVRDSVRNSYVLELEQLFIRRLEDRGSLLLSSDKIK